MDAGRIVKWLIILGLVLILWKFGVPWLRKSSLGSSSGAVAADSPCVRAAAQASETWGSGIGRFANSQDSTAWSTFRGTVEGRIRAAEAACGCAQESCEKARGAMAELRGVVSDMDSAFRSNSGPPGDVVQRQEAIDNQIDEARELAASGR